MRSGDTAPLNLNLNTREMWAVSCPSHFTVVPMEHNGYQHHSLTLHMDSLLCVKQD